MNSHTETSNKITQQNETAKKQITVTIQYHQENKDGTLVLGELERATKPALNSCKRSVKTL